MNKERERDMSKAVYLMDMPQQCTNCRFCRMVTPIKVVCNGTDKPYEERLMDYSYAVSNRPDWCPLRELPSKKELVPYQTGDWQSIVKNIENNGYNDCLDEILGSQVEIA